MDRESNLVVISAFLALNVPMACIFDLYKKLKGSSVLNNIQCRVSSSIWPCSGFPSSTTPQLRSDSVSSDGAVVVCYGNVSRPAGERSCGVVDDGKI